MEGRAGRGPVGRSLEVRRVSPAGPLAHPRPWPGILAALLALAVSVGWALWYQARAAGVAALYVRAVGPLNLPFKAETLLLQRAALRQADVLPIYGTSELYCCAAPFNAGTFFAQAPTGFSVFNVGYPVTQDLIFAETFGALGRSLQGKRVVVSDSAWFDSPTGISAGSYAPTYSPEIATTFAFAAPLPMALRQAVARRMLDFPGTLQNDVLLRAALEALARGGRLGDAQYALLRPMGWLAVWLDQERDAYQTMRHLQALEHPAPSAAPSGPAPAAPALPGPRAALADLREVIRGEGLDAWLGLSPPNAVALMRGIAPGGLDPVVPDRPGAIPWTADLRTADAMAAAQSNNNPFGVLNAHWTKCTDVEPANMCQQALALYRSGRSNHDGGVYAYPGQWVAGVVTCTCWTDLSLEFQVLDALQARPLAWVQPLEGRYSDYTPYSAAARQLLYTQYLSVAAAGVPATTFQTHDTDALFVDSFGHLSQRGWLYADRLLDLFWHGQVAQGRPGLAQGGSVNLLFSPALDCPNAYACQGVDGSRPGLAPTPPPTAPPRPAPRPASRPPAARAV